MKGPDMAHHAPPEAHVSVSTSPIAIADPATRMSLVILACLALVFALDVGKVILAPVCLSIVVGSLFGPAADRLGRLGIPSWVSAALMVVLFILLITTAGAAFMVPLSDWLDKLPLIWAKLQSQLVSWQGLFASISSLQEELRNAMGQSGNMQVSVDETSPVESVFYFAPTFMAQIILFLASLYFFVLTRPRVFRSTVDWSTPATKRYRMAIAFQRIEKRLSTYLLSITCVNVGLAAAVSAALWLIGVPSPILWGVLAGVLNYVIYIGPAIMVLIMTGVGLSIGNSIPEILLPPLVYLLLNLFEAQFVTPTVLGRTMTLNPFLVFLTIAFWIWLWGPIGGFIAVPALLAGVTLYEISNDPSD
ncbi:AI-2E family transporter [Roseibium sp.]|uniref:AI-2E family transporter n=1 Tax=Roseibium sp. TaxID=1936156 RepID=UPI00391DBBAF